MGFQGGEAFLFVKIGCTSRWSIDDMLFSRLRLRCAGLSDLDRPFVPGSRLLAFLLPRTADDASRPAGELGGRGGSRKGLCKKAKGG